jgi:hypothetical protein
MALQCERREGGSPGINPARAAYICCRMAWCRSGDEGKPEAAEVGISDGGADETGGGLVAAMIIMALAFCASAAATIRLLFSASDVEKRGFLKSSAGSMNPGGMPYPGPGDIP